MPRKSVDGLPDFVIKPKAADYYKVLGVAPSATLVQIKAQYYALARVSHPDVGGNASEMAAITEAYGVLGKPAARKAYDAKRKFLSKPCPVCKGEGVTYRNISWTRRKSIPCTACNATGTQGGKA